MTYTSKAKRTALRAVRSAGYEVNRVDQSPRVRYAREAQPIFDRRSRQTVDTVRTLQRKYEAPVFGVISMWDALNMLAHVIDEVDPFLGNVSQEIHTLQVVEGLAADGADDTMLLAGLIHDVGKVIALVDEDPANIFGTTEPIGHYEPAIGLDQCVFQWGADEYGYSKVAGRVPDHVSWLVRYHSIVPEACVHLMDERDREYFEKYWRVLNRLDHTTKSMYQLPRTRLSDYRAMIDEAFPEPIPF
jgi:inositol oxygenase